MTSNYQYASPRYGRRYHRNLGYLGYQGRTEEHGGVVSGVLGVPKEEAREVGVWGTYGTRAGEPGGVVSGVPGIPGAIAGAPGGVVFAGVPRVSGAGGPG